MPLPSLVSHDVKQGHHVISFLLLGAAFEPEFTGGSIGTDQPTSDGTP